MPKVFHTFLTTYVKIIKIVEEVAFNILSRKFFINICESKADCYKVSREMLFRVATLTTYVKVIEIGVGPVHRQVYRAILLYNK